MNKKLFLPLLGLVLMGCQTNNDFQYTVDKFYDLEILRYKVPGFDDLTLKQKTFLYYLSEAAVNGRDIIYDQNCRYNLTVRHALEHVYRHYPNKEEANFALLEKYLKRVWFSNGIHHHYSADKFLPEFDREWFEQALAQTNYELSDEVMEVIFNPDVMAKRMNQAPGQDLIKTSAGNYYGEGVSQAQAERWYMTHEDKSDQPLWIGLNSQLCKDKNGRLYERVYKVGGLYGAALERVVYWLKKALPLAETEEQSLAIEKLIELNETGDLKAFNDYCIAWVQDLNSRVDFVNGFTETYGDPLGVTGAWEAMVNFKDLEATKRTQLISDNAQWFEDHSTTDSKYKKAEVKGVTAKVITAAMLGGDIYPYTAIGINLPNASWIRVAYGSKSVSIDNLSHAYAEAAKGNGFNEEYVIDAQTIQLMEQYGVLCNDLHTDLHECVGHGSGQLMPNVSKTSLKEHASTIEEARADLFGLYYLADSKLVELGLMPNKEAYKAGYYQQMMNGLMTQLVRIEPGKDIEESHMRDRALIANWVYEHAVNKEVELIKRDGKTYLQINDYEGLRRLYGELLKEVQRITSEGDYEAGKALVEQYAVKVNQELHKEILDRYAALDLAPYKGFVNPRYVVETNADGEITDIKLDFTEGFVEQHLRYSNDYANLPLVN